MGLEQEHEHEHEPISCVEGGEVTKKKKKKNGWGYMEKGA